MTHPHLWRRRNGRCRTVAELVISSSVEMQILSDYFADAMWNACNERITHAESAMAVGHAVVGPSFGEHL